MQKLFWLVALLFAIPAWSAEKLERGQDRIDVPVNGAGLALHNLFQSGMVLQRDKPIRVWGWAEPGEKVTVTFSVLKQTATAGADRQWQVMLPPALASSEPLRLTVQGQAKKIELDNILIGDVWLLGGQSNMEFEIGKVENGDLEIAAANFPNIRLFTVPQASGPDKRTNFPALYQWSDWSGRHFRQGYWDVCTPETVRDMSAIGYVFARRLHLAAQIPIGVIDVSRGGTTVETWTPLEVLNSIDTPEVKAKLTAWQEKVAAFDPQQDLAERIKKHHDRLANLKQQGKELPKNDSPPSDLQPGPAMDMNRPGNCYAAMLAPLAGLSIKGALWHQGYNNALEPNGHRFYAQVFPPMIRAWRAAFNDPQMPFGIISQETDGDPQDRDDYLEKMLNEGIYIREVHYNVWRDLYKAGDKNIGYADSYDQRRAWYHPQIKIPVGERIARWALATQYGMSKQVRWLPPQLKEVRPEGEKLVLQLDSPVVPFHDGPLTGFAIAGKDGRFQLADANVLMVMDKQGKPQQDRTSIVLSSPLVPEPVYFRHAWGRNPLANVKAQEHVDLPLPAIRNDNWTIADMYELYTSKKPATPNVLDGRENGELLRALRGDDLKRRLFEARELIKANEK